MSESNAKLNGVFHTPKDLARFVADMAITCADCTILDPCFGEGSLLSAAYDRLLAIGSLEPNKKLFGYDIAPRKDCLQKEALNELLGSGNLQEGDFFAQSSSRTGSSLFGVILMNPPFVRHHLIPRETQERVRELTKESVLLPMTSDLWTYFLVHSLKFIRKSGTLAAILPWSFLRADYAKPVRQLLADNFGMIKVVMIGHRMFPGAEERVLVLCATGFGAESSNIAVYYSFDIPKGAIPWKRVEQKAWVESPPASLLSKDISSILSEVAKDVGFAPLGNYAKIRIGTVTGANGFFTLPMHKARAIGIPPSMLRPVIKHSNQLGALSISDEKVSDVLLLISDEALLPGSLQDYIQSGEASHLNERYHASRRSKWYCLPEQPAPEAFLPYMIKEVPFLVFNGDGLLSTNTVHRVDFRDGLDRESKKWIQLSMLTSISQVSIELSARTYGGGVLKIEPSAANTILVSPGNGHEVPSTLEPEVTKLLAEGRRLEAMDYVDNWLVSSWSVPLDKIDSIRALYLKLRCLRLGINEAKEPSTLSKRLGQEPSVRQDLAANSQ